MSFTALETACADSAVFEALLTTVQEEDSCDPFACPDTENDLAIA